jgi:uncharacterized protein HemY
MVVFLVISTKKSRKVQDQETVIRKTFANTPDSSCLHSFFGTFYINHSLLQDAIKEFQIIKKINANAPLQHKISGSLFSDNGYKDKAIDELQKALALTKNMEK